MAAADRSWKANALIHEGRRRKGIGRSRNKQEKKIDGNGIGIGVHLQDAEMHGFFCAWAVALKDCGGGIRCK